MAYLSISRQRRYCLVSNICFFTYLFKSDLFTQDGVSKDSKVASSPSISIKVFT